jgi:hypothetical protein
MPPGVIYRKANGMTSYREQLRADGKRITKSSAARATEMGREHLSRRYGNLFFVPIDIEKERERHRKPGVT